MNTKAFISLMVAVLVLGAVVGGSFLGGLTIGKSQETDAAASVTPVPEGSDLTDGLTLGRLREQAQSGQLSQEDLAQLRQQFQGQFGGGGPGGGGFAGGARFGSGGGLVGTIEKIEGDTITVNTSQGTLLATVADDTTIQKMIEVTSAELTEGTRVTVAGARGEDGTVQADSIFVLPEDASEFGGGRPGS